jgi:predicted nucleic acid-binding protein
MNNLFVDTDVIIDFLADRKPFSGEAAVIFSLAEQGSMKVYTSSLTFSNLYYVLRKFETHEKLITRLEGIAELVKILKVDERIIKNAFKVNLPDYEDSIQYCCALDSKVVDIIITRNVKDFKNITLPVMTPGEFLKTVSTF